MAALGEVEFVTGIAAMSASGNYGQCRVAEGIVGGGDLSVGARVRELLEAKFREGFAQLAPLGLSFESWQYHPQLPDATDLARAFPDTTIILNHVGGVLGVGPYNGRR